MADYTNAAQQRLLRLITVLAGNELHGISPGELATALNTTPSSITRDLANLREAGWADEMADTGRWRLGTKPVQIAVSFTQGIQRAQAKLDEISARYTREP